MFKEGVMNEDISFGSIVKERRNALGLTQTELARRVGCAAVTVRKIEYDALRPSVQIAEHLAVALNIPQKEQLAFVRLARAEREPTPIPTPPPVPEEIGQKDLSGRAVHGFQLAERIGTGGYGAVYRATQAGIDREVAIKIILPKYADRPEFIRRFEAEAQLVARLEHPHIVPLYDYWREPGVAYLVMRFLRGGSLETLLKDGPLTTEVLLHLLEQICAALHTAHRVGVIHRDIKPANVLLDEDGNAYLADFGVAKDLTISKTADLTQDDVVIGSPAYISPEQILVEPVKPQTDIYSLGVMLYELLTGRKPFPGPTPVAYIQQHLNEPLPLLSQQNSDSATAQDVPSALDVVIGRATAKNPNDRYADIPTFIDDFRQAIVLSMNIPLSVAQAQRLAIEHCNGADLENPYKGLRAFGEADAADFFGRDTLIQALLGRLAEAGDLSRFLAVIGPSGSGKSSVVRAGLIPALRQGGLPDSDKWFIVEMMPGSHPLEELEAALLRIAVNPPESLLAQLQKDERGLLRAVRRILPPDNTIELVLVIDQFEEIFTLCDDETGRIHLLDSLVTAVLDPRSRLRVVITLRADFTDRPLQYVDFGELVRQRTEFVLPLTPDELEDVILKPAERVGLTVEPGLAETIITDLGDQPGTLPLLQYTLTELFERRVGRVLTLGTYQASGGVRGALAARADDLYTELDEAGRKAARQLFLRLITPGEFTGDGLTAPDTRRRVLRSELVSIQPPSNSPHRGENASTSPPVEGIEGGQLLDQVIDLYGRHRLLTFDRDPVTRGPTVEVAHEALIREWERLRQWLDEDREFLLWQQRLRAALHQWQASEQDEGALLRGAPLAEAENWHNQRWADLNKVEREFIQTSLALQERRESEREQERIARERLRRRITQGLAVGLVIAIVLLVLAGWQWQRAAQERQVALDAQATAAAERDQAQNSVSRQLAVQDLAHLEGQLDLALLLSVEAVQTADTADAQSALLTGLETSPQLTTFLRDHTDPVKSVAFSSDGQILASGSNDGTIILWDVATGQPLGPPLTGHTDTVRSVAFSPDGQTLASSSFDNTIILWNVATLFDTGGASGQPLDLAQDHLTGHTDAVWNVAFSPDGQTLASGSADDSIILWDVATGQPLGPPLIGHDSSVTSVAFNPDGQTLASSSMDKSLILWDVATGQPLGSPLVGHTDAVRSVAFSPDGQTLASGGDHIIVLWDVATGQPLGSPLTAHTEPVWNVAFSPDGQILASSSVDGSVILWDVATRRSLGPPLTGHRDAVWSVAFSPDGQTLASGSSDNTIILWKLDPPHPLGTRLTGHTDTVWSLDFSPDGKTLASGSADNTIILWDMADAGALTTPRPLGPPLTNHTSPVWNVAFSPDGKILASGGNQTIILWDTATYQPLSPPLISHRGDVRGLDFSPDGQTLASGSTDKTIILWDVANAGALATHRPSGQPLTGHTSPIGGAHFNSDGKTLASISFDGTIFLWDVTTGHPLGPPLSGARTNYDSIAFSPDGKTLAYAGNPSGAIFLWDMTRNQPLNSPITDHSEVVNSLDFSPDGKILASGNGFGTVILSDIVSGQPLGLPLTGHTLAIVSVAFSPNGKTVASGSEDKTIMLWDVNPESWQARACRRTNRNFTQAEWQQFFGDQPYRATCPELPVPEE
jgi:WD40 repeat protein/transcriptional regulator with XRE-family HTH domain/tRNA A-37 threonylcarbamoyl transferase component Bud32